MLSEKTIQVFVNSCHQLGSSIYYYEVVQFSVNGSYEFIIWSHLHKKPLFISNEGYDNKLKAEIEGLQNLKNNYDWA